jgi:hypothetical protein
MRMRAAARRFVSLQLMLLISWSIFAGGAAARWAGDEDAAWEVEYQNIDTVVHADGTWEDVTETRTRVLKESARTRVAIERHAYNSNIQTFEVLSAYTVVGERSIAVDAARIEDKPMASTPFGFDEVHQVIIPFAEVDVGASVVTKIRRVTREVALPGLWSGEFVFGLPTRERAGRITIRSERPLYVSKNDPGGVLRIDHTVDGPGTSVSVSLTEPVYRLPVDENDTWLDFESIPWVAISTAQNWPEVMGAMREQYEQVLAAPLPERFDAIRAKAATMSEPTDQLNAITSELASQIHYLGDWRTLRGKYVPRELAAVAATQSGDCKDFATVTVAILRALGIGADVAWIRRGMPYRRFPATTPLQSDFNHAIVHVRAHGVDRWIDPTNSASFAQGTYPDIAGRPALVVTGDAPALLTTPATQPVDGQVRVSRIVHFASEERQVIDGTLALQGFSALRYTGAELTVSKRSVDHALAGYFGDENELREWTLDPYDLSSRVVRDLEFHAHLVQRDSPMRTSAGDAYYLGSGGHAIEALLTQTNERVSGLVNGSPYVYTSTTELRDVRRVGGHSLDCSVTSPWIDFTRTVADVPGGVRIEDHAVLQRQVISNVELKSRRFADVQARIRECLSGASVVYERLTPSVAANVAALSAPGATAAEAAESSPPR